MDFTFRPLRKELWARDFTPERQRRSRNTFSAPWSNTMKLLQRELKHLGAKDPVIEAAFREQDIRLDGLPRANAKVPEFPGIRLAFNSKHGELVYQTDSCVFWEHNVRSIALGLESLRDVDRYGITSRAEQYTGWKAIEGPSPEVTGFLNEVDAMAWLHSKSGIVGSEGLSTKSLTRLVAKVVHPDQGGTREDFARYENAVAMLKKEGLLS